MRYVDATGDDGFERGEGIEILVDTARLWRSLGHHDVHGAFRIDGVTGPDEYSAIADNNVYTNLMAQRNLRGAARTCERHQDRARELGVGPEEMAAWRAAADAMFVPYDEGLGVHEQAERFTSHAEWDFAATRPDQYPLMLHFPYFNLYRKQVVKQPDLVLAMHLRGDAFTKEQKERNFRYYERLTVRDSSLSACTQAVMAAEVGLLRLALDYTVDAALVDLEDREHNARDGLHVASLAGTWIALVAGFGGMRDHETRLTFAPRLPEGITRLSFTVVRRGLALRVEVGRHAARYRLLDERGALEIAHHGEPFTVHAGAAPVEREIPPALEAEPAEQPPGREIQRASRTPAGPRPIAPRAAPG